MQRSVQQREQREDADAVVTGKVPKYGALLRTVYDDFFLSKSIEAAFGVNSVVCSQCFSYWSAAVCFSPAVDETQQAPHGLQHNTERTAWILFHTRFQQKSIVIDLRRYNGDILRFHLPCGHR